ncbi:hypothetical protein [Ferruginibacter sp.]|nr:hypothetical protein [Ferruginibacter sp.]
MKIMLISFLLIFSAKRTFCQYELAKGDKLDKVISRGDSDIYKIRIEKGEFCKLIVIQNGIDVMVDVSSEDG